MYFRFRKPRSLSEIRRPQKTLTERRRDFPVAIIDNEPFARFDTLVSHGFSLRELGDIDDIAAVAEYPIVSCDIKDVGAAFESPFGGAHLIMEIRKRYPDKYVIAYSAGMFHAEYKRPLDYSDVFLRKGTSIDEWRVSHQ